MISAVQWVPKGVSKSVLDLAEPPSKEEIEEMLKEGVLDATRDSENEENEMEGEDVDMEDDAVVASAADDTAGEELEDEVSHAIAVANALGMKSSKSERSRNKKDDIAVALKELDMDNYDDEDDDIELFGNGLGDLFYPSNDMDPYLKDNDDEDSEEIEDITIQPKDSVIVCARTEEEFCHLEVWIYEESADGGTNMYVHHDVVLSAFPLCLAWLDCPIKGGEKGNFIAVGSMDPAIEIWDLDIMDEVQPSLVLGGAVEKKKKKGKKRSTKYKECSHTESVLGLAWNKHYRNILASASADKQVKIWDVATGECDITMEHHIDKVQAVAWNHHEPQVLLSGSFDRTVVMKDGRRPSHPGFKWMVSTDVESLAWDPHNNHSFVVSLEDGTVQGFDIRAASSSASDSKPSFTLHAHDKAVSSVSYNPVAPNFLATGSTDKMVKLWDLSNNQPSCVASQNPKAGAVFSVSFSTDNPFLLAIGGSKGKLEVWDTLTDAGVMRRFGSHNQWNNSL